MPIFMDAMIEMYNVGERERVRESERERERQREKREREGKRERDYSGHDHLLVFAVLGDGENQFCDTCRSQIFSYNDAYCCSKCQYYIHCSCSEFQREIEHPCHSQHKLSLFCDKDFSCQLCRKDIKCGGFGYHCPKCRFVIDIDCTHLTPTDPMSQQQFHKKVTHKHPLIICDFKSGFDVMCSSCHLPLTNAPIFVCLECRFFLDESCATLPREIQHPFHKPHPLTLMINSPYKSDVIQYVNSQIPICFTCRVRNNKEIIYRCLVCPFPKFDLDVVCASLRPISTNDKSDKKSDPKYAITHSHPLITCYKTKDSLLVSCSACLQPFVKEGAIYVCLDCRRLLHKLCACLPRQISEHPYHPEHIFSLLDGSRLVSSSSNNQYECAACTEPWDSNVGNFAYKCDICKFLLHSKCALPAAPLINSKLHKQHPLAFLDIQTALKCNACNLLCFYPFFKCLQCAFNLHAHCLPELPPSIKYKWHLHPLTLTNSPIKDYEDEEEDDPAEFYCDACEKYRLLNEPTYYCAECHYVAHVHCVISEILPGLQSESSSLGGKELLNDVGEEDVTKKEEKEIAVPGAKIVVHLKVTDRSETRKELENIVGDPVLAEIDTNIATMQTGLDELKARLEVLTREVETQTINLEQLKKSRALHMLSKQQ